MSEWRFYSQLKVKEKKCVSSSDFNISKISLSIVDMIPLLLGRHRKFLITSVSIFFLEHLEANDCLTAMLLQGCGCEEGLTDKKVPINLKWNQIGSLWRDAKTGII